MPMKNRRHNNEEAVTTLQMSILILALIIYSATFYCCFEDRGGEISGLAAGSIAIDVIDSSCVNISFGAFTRNLEPIEVKVIITNMSDQRDTVELWFSGPPDNSTVEMETAGGVAATYTDYNYRGNEINSGDYILVYGLNAHTTYEIMLYHHPTQSLITLVGQTTFTIE